MVLYGITLVPLAEEICEDDIRLINPFYKDDVDFDESIWWSAQILKLLLERGADQGHLIKLAKSIFISYFSDQEDMVKR